ncbi:MAG: glutamate formimidoyltransferase [Candidatus Poseidoniales archaeon]
MSLKKIVECVPNFSEGRDKKIIDQICSAITTVETVELLDVDMGSDTNRTVVTFIAESRYVVTAAYKGIEKAAELIDMKKHTGAHPRMGATDVCPFIPVSNTTMEECVDIARSLGEIVGDKLGIPIFLYESAAINQERQNLANIRSGEYEGFDEKLKEQNWKPDFGPSKLNVKSGVTAIGAREFLIAYNINLNTTDRTYANEIAYELRERGRWKRVNQKDNFYYKGDVVNFKENFYPDGNSDYVGKNLEEIEEFYQKNGHNFRKRYNSLGLDPDNLIGKPVYKDGRFTHVKGLGWVIPEYNRAQISMNLTNYKISPIHKIFEAACEEAEKRGLRVTGSEIVGLVPYKAIEEAGKYYLNKMGKSPGMPPIDLVNIAIQSLGLSDVIDFNPSEKILGMPKNNGELANRITFDLIDEVSRDSPAPGGGSVAAMSGSLGVALGVMVANLSTSKAGFEKHSEELGRIAEEGQEIKEFLVKAIDEDTNAFDKVIKAMRMPKDSDSEKKIREEKMQEGYKAATEIPLETVEYCYKALNICDDISKLMDSSMASDVGSGAHMSIAGARAAAYNVRINLNSIKDEDYANDTKTKLNKLLSDCDKRLEIITQRVEEKL